MPSLDRAAPRLRLAGAVALAAVLLVSYGCKKAPQAAVAPEQLREAPDLGGVQLTAVETQGKGPTRGAAIADALGLAVKQVNGGVIDTATLSIDGSLSAPGYSGALGLSADMVATATNGVVREFKLISATSARPFMGKGEVWTVKVSAKIAKYAASQDAGKPRVAVARPRMSQTVFRIGDDSRSATDISNDISGAITTALSDTGRFFLINREFDDVIASELAQINSDNIRPDELAKLKQKLAADIIVLPQVKTFEYRKSSQRLNLSGRTVESYSGEVRIAFAVLNVATGQLISQEEFYEKLPEIPPRLATGQSVGGGVAADYLGRSARYFSEKFVQSTFPIAVLKLDGTSVVLSQGGSLVHEGAVYQAVKLGEKIVDPQTGKSLGREETPAGEVRITRVDAKLSYGAFEGAAPAGAFRPGLFELRGQLDRPGPGAPLTIPAPAAGEAATAPRRPAPRRAGAAGRDDSWPEIETPRARPRGADPFETAG